MSELERRIHAADKWKQICTIRRGEFVTIEQVDPDEGWTTHPDKGDTDGDGFAYSGELAQEGSLVVGVYFGGLVAQIHRDDADEWRNWWIGKDDTIRAPFDGILYVAANDDTDGYDDNSGSILYRFKVTVAGPDLSPAAIGKGIGFGSTKAMAKRKPGASRRPN